MLDDLYPKVQPGPPRPSEIIQPQVFFMLAGTERYVVEGSGAVEAGDQVKVINDEGGQVAEIVAADGKGRVDLGILGVFANAKPAGLQALLTGFDQSLPVSWTRGSNTPWT